MFDLLSKCPTQGLQLAGFFISNEGHIADTAVGTNSLLSFNRLIQFRGRGLCENALRYSLNL